jgi:hypothetical protein
VEVADETQELKNISPEDVDAVTEKLKEWMPTLPEREELLMGWLLTRAAAAAEADADVEGYAELAAGAPLSVLVADALGFEEVASHLQPVWTFRW